MAASADGPKPVTLDITDRLSSNLDIAREVRSRLVSLKDRLLGSVPSNAAAPTGSRGEPYCFADAAACLGADLREVLTDIDIVSSELANRL
jgi:hypothetical protein